MNLFKESDIFIADFYDILLAKYHGKTYYAVDWATEGRDDRSCKITWTEHNGKLYVTGLNGNGQLGLNSTSQKTSFTINTGFIL